MRLVAAVAFATALISCIRPGSNRCEDGRVCPATKACDDAHTLCLDPGQLEVCGGLAELASCTWDRGTGLCRDGVCLAAECGNGFIDQIDAMTREACDEADRVGGDGCSSDCLSDETCGNGVIDFVTGERCDDGNAISHDGCASTCEAEVPRWIEHSYEPTGRRGAAAAYDSVRDRVVMFGGRAPDIMPGVEGPLLTTTLEWDGLGWVDSGALGAPLPRDGAVMVYDQERARIILFGGRLGDNGGVSETWEYDGLRWTLLATTGPKARIGAAMVYDPVRKKIVLFGGKSLTSSSPLSDTWEWDNGDAQSPAAWHDVTSVGPTRRWLAAATYDPSRRVVVITGGTNETTVAPPFTALTDTWEYDGSWRKSKLDDAPAQYAHTVGWDPITERVIAVSGGTDIDGAEFWSWDGANWSAAATSSSLDARSEHVLVNTGRHLLLFGGIAGTAVQNDTWRFDGGTFRLEDLPATFQSTQAANDLARRRVVVYYYGITWELDEHAWRRVSSASSSQPHPQADVGVALGYDPVRKETIAFGGTPLTFGADTLAFDGTVWTPRTPATRPPARSQGKLVFDGSAQKLLLFGGIGTSGQLGDTWYWDGMDWTGVTGPGPSPRKGHALGFDAIRKQVILFGGRDAVGLNDDTWIFDGTWHEVMLAATPTRREGATLTWNPARQRLVLAGGPVDVLDVWEWNGEGWEGVATLSPTQWVTAHVGFAWPDGRGIAVQGGLSENRLWELTYLAAVPDERCANSTVDVDGDGLIACNDPDCWSVCTPLCLPTTPTTTCPASDPHCGDGTCDASESCETCSDCVCEPRCGDYRCDPAEQLSCGGDCP